jgi:UDP-N-acetylmuramate--alanine ligase
VKFVPDWQEAADYLASIARDGDFVVTLGCGDVYRIIPQVLDSLRRPSEA